MKCYTGIGIVCLVLCTQVALSVEIDSDKDGLSNYQERHKYFTDPAKQDSDGDGVPDGDWHERREYAYTIRSVLKVMRPCDTTVINDDYQDARVLSETKEYVELEVIHYPFNTNAESIGEQEKWREHSSKLYPYLQPGLSTNWDEDMRKDLLTKLQADGIDLNILTDRKAVEMVSAWLLDRGKYRYMFGTYFVYFPQGKAAIYPGLEEAFRQEKGNTALPFSRHIQHEIYGKGMFYNKSYGTCTSTAIYLTTAMRAIGIPTRMILTIPCVDPSDPKQVQMIEDHISHNQVRHSLLKAMSKLQRGFVCHTFNEVYVDGRWRRLDYKTLGQNIFGKGTMGLFTHTHTFNDLSESGLTKTWGWRYGKGERDEVFRTSNPYRALELSDRFGIHLDLDNPTVEIKEHKTITISKLYWRDSKDAPDIVRNNEYVKSDGAGHLFIHGEEWFKGEHYTQYKDFMSKADQYFKLIADGYPSIHSKLSSLYITDETQELREIEIKIEAKEYERMQKGVPYRLVPNNSNEKYQWKVPENISITKP